MSADHEFKREQIHVLASPNLSFPLCSQPIRFAVRIKDGSVSSLWTTVVRKTGDVYIIPRNVGDGAKISLHASGQQHLKIDRPPWGRMVWKEPPRGCPLPASVKLIFTVWSAGMGPTKNYSAAHSQKKLKTNQVFIAGEDSEDSVISVYFFLASPGTHFELPPHLAREMLADLPVGAGKNLYIVVCKENRPNLRLAIEQRLEETVASHPVAANWSIGRKSSLLLNGFDIDGCPYVAPVAVEMTEEGMRLLRCRQARVVLPEHACRTEDCDLGGIQD